MLELPTFQMIKNGQKVGHYKIISALGAGGMGEVYLAEDTGLGRQAALKLLPFEVSQNAERIRRFVQEAKAASALNHPNILTIYEIGSQDNLRFIASEFIAGETLRERMSGERLSIDEALNIAVQTVSALVAAHEAGIIHRDIKPENIMIRRDRLVKVLDFGLAKLTENKVESTDAEAETRAQMKTAPGVILGTAAYMSPEQARGKAVDARSDIWSLGVVLYEMLTRRQPFFSETLNDTIAAILTKEPTAPTNFNEEVPAELERIILKTVAKDVEERYQTAKDLLVDLKRLKKQLELGTEIKRAAASSAGRQTAEQSEKTTRILPAQTTSNAEFITGKIKNHKIGVIALSILLLAAAGFVYWFLANRPANTAQIASIAVLPFVNENGNADNEYLSDGMTETLISSLSQIPKLNVKARSSVFRYKGKDTSMQIIGKELNVQAILTGRVVQRGQELILYVELVEAATENSLWKQTYNKTVTNLVTLQNDIARDVADKLKVKLSGTDEQKLARNYTENTEAYQLYLKGRFHIYKLTPPEVYKGISYLQQAIEIDPNYALAYAGLSDAYRSLAVGGEMLPADTLPKSKAAAQKAIELDETLAEGHIALGISIFWYDWDWSAAEIQYKRALVLDPNNANSHLFYAHMLSNTARHTEALAEIKRARELDPLAPFVGAIEGLFLLQAGRNDEALDRLQKTFELDPNFWMPHLFASSAYIEKGMYQEAIAEARRTRELAPYLTITTAYASYALAKSGKRDEARAGLEELLKLANSRFVPPTHIAVIYNGLGETNEALAWLEKGYQQRDPKMAFLKVDMRWNNLRSDPRFQDIMRRVGFPQ